MNTLATKICIPCTGAVPALSPQAYEPLLKELSTGWAVVDGHHLEKTYLFDNFAHALAFTNHVGAIAEHEGHHPDIYLAWGKVQLRIWTHKINGLTESDFILAAKIDLSR